jgi:hypothetical protein
MFKNDYRGQITGSAWLILLFVVGLIIAGFIWIIMGQVNNGFYDYVNPGYVEPGTISQANYDVGVILQYGWFWLPVIIIVGLPLGYIIRSLVMRGG